MVRCRPFTHAAPTREADLPVKFHAKNTPALPANRKGQSGKVLLCPQQDNLATSVVHFCIAVLTQEGREAAQARGVTFGRPGKLKSDQKNLARELVKEGQSISAVARTFNVHPATIYRCINENQPL
jgi:hypothetical protein